MSRLLMASVIVSVILSAFAFTMLYTETDDFACVVAARKAINTHCHGY